MLDARTIIEFARTVYGMELTPASAERVANELALLSKAIGPLVDDLALDDRPGKLERLLLARRQR